MFQKVTKNLDVRLNTRVRQVRLGKNGKNLIVDDNGKIEE